MKFSKNVKTREDTCEDARENYNQNDVAMK